MNVFDYSRSELEFMIDEWVICRKNSKRNRDIFKRALLDGESQEQIAEQFDMSTRQIQNIIYACQRQLFPHLK